MENVIWKTYPKNTAYEISNAGQLRNRQTGTIRKPFRTKKGYLTVKLAAGNVRLHQAAALTFLGERPSAIHEPNHKNGLPDDNRVENLEWLTPEENHQHAAQVLRKRLGEGNSQARLNHTQVRVIKHLIRRMKYATIGELFGVAGSTIGSIACGQSWRHV